MPALVRNATANELELMVDGLLEDYKSECLDQSNGDEDLYWRTLNALTAFTVERERMAARTRYSVIGTILGTILLGAYLFCSWKGWI